MPVQNKPIIHGRDHETDGADPIRGLLPPTSVAGDYPAAIRGLDDLRGYWRLGEGAEPFADTSGYNPGDPADLDANPGTVGSTPMTQDVTPGLLHEAHDDGAVAFNDTNDDGVARPYLTDTDTSSRSHFDFSSGHPNMSVIARIEPSGGTASGGIVSFADAAFDVGLGLYYTRGWALRVLSSMQVEFFRGSTDSLQIAATSPPVTADEAHSIVGTYDGALIRLYIDGSLAASVADTSNLPSLAGIPGGNIRIGGHHESVSPSFPTHWRPYVGVVDEVAVLGSVLTDADIAALHELAETGEVPEGYVPIIGGDGEPVWAPPGTEVEHGDGDPEENPVTTPGGEFAGLPVSPSGWHYAAHREHIVLYDSSPGRFDVPPRKWTRVPFNTVRIQRTWELEVDGSYRSAFMPDDRGLSEHAKNGTLLVTAGMLFNFEWLSGWFTLEYPWLDWTRLPNAPPTEAYDSYSRGARMTNGRGQVLRRGAPDIWGELRAFVDWGFDQPYGCQPFDSPWDNPYPGYAAWPARPLNKPLPYPKVSNAASLDYYKDSVGNPGFFIDHLLVERAPAAGDAISLQAWQDTPWLLRFGTDHYPPYTPYNYVEDWLKRPSLAYLHYYDPETINHDTGLLL